jgi:hypothetical protein
MGGISDFTRLRAFDHVSILVAGSQMIAATRIFALSDAADRILRLNAVLDRTGLSRSTLPKDADRRVLEKHSDQRALRRLARVPGRTQGGRNKEEDLSVSSGCGTPQRA